MKLTTDEQEQIKDLILPLLGDLHRLANYMCNNTVEAEDVVAETVKKACEKFRTLRNHANIKPWLFQILRNTFVSLCRARKRYKNEPFDEDPCAEDENFSLFTEVSQPFLLWWGNPEQELLDKLLERDIRQSIDELSDCYRIAVILCDVEGLAYQETSFVLNLPIGTVRSRIARGRSILQKKLYQHAVDRGLIHNNNDKNL